MIDKKQAAIIALAILQYKVLKHGMDLRPKEFDQKIKRFAALFKCSEEQVREFYTQFLLPSTLKGCGLFTHVQPAPAMNDLEEKIAITTVMDECFDSTKHIGDEIRRICSYKSTLILPAKIMSLAHFIINERLKREFGRDFTPEEVKI